MKIHTVYVLAKNEIRNIERSLNALSDAGLKTVLLDSGSTDGTLEAAGRYTNVVIERFEYKNHCDAYNLLTSRHAADEVIMVLDADMCVSDRLVNQLQDAFCANNALQAVIAPVLMYWEGRPLRYCSLYPPKPIAFRGGGGYFEAVGHGEKLKSGIAVTRVEAELIHDDRKPQNQVLANQWRYAQAMVDRVGQGRASWRDRLRVRTPLFMLITPVYTYIAKLGILDGRIGFIYALDRLIAEALAYRASLVSRLDRAKGGALEKNIAHK